MYSTHFLQGENTLTNDAQQIIERSVLKVYDETHKELDFKECAVFVVVNSKKIPAGEMFLGFPYDQTAVYLFADDIKTASHNRDHVDQNATEHLYRSLYATARASHMGLDADCGLLEEVVGEGLSEVFVTEKMSTAPKERYTLFSDADIKQLWGKMKCEFDAANPDVEKWFWGNVSEGVPPFTACSVGFAVAKAYLDAVKKRSVEVLTTPAKDMVVVQNRY